jgi:ABC-2 type transport system permease protein
MKLLLYKEFKLAVHPLYLVSSFVFAALLMIPQWIFFLVPLYFFMVTAPNLLGQYRVNKDNQFTILLPVSRDDVVKARILAFSILELIHIGFTVIFMLFHHLAYGGGFNFGFDLNGAYIGITFLIFGVFNIVLFPLYYKTAETFGIPVIIAVAAAALLAAAAEVPVMISRPFAHVMEEVQGVQIIVLISGIALYPLLTFVAYRLAVQSFRRVGL